MNKRGPLEPDIQKAEDFEPRLPRAKRGLKSNIFGRLKALRRNVGGGKRKTRAGRRAHGSKGKLRAPRAFKQRVVVKARVVTGSGKKALQRLRAHISYLNRSGTGLTGARPEFFNHSEKLEREHLSKAAVQWKDDPHHFRFIISPEKGAELQLESYVKHVVMCMEEDLKTKLEWYAACHYNTDNPHAHLVVRGVDEKGKTLLISRDYLSHGIRHVAEREATRTLGERTVREVEKGIQRTLRDDRFTFLDAELKKSQDQSSEKLLFIKPVLGTAREWERKARTNKLVRLAYLESRGLAKEISTGKWKLHDDLEGVLKEMSERRSIEKVISPHLIGLEARKQELVIHRESEPFKFKLKGIVLTKDLLDELNQKSFILLNADDGRTHFIPLGRFSEPSGFECRAGQLVTVSAPKEHPVKAESVIYRYLGERQGEFDIERFRDDVKRESGAGRWRLPDNLSADEYAEMFVTRCETLTKAGILKEISEGKWQVPDGFLDQVNEYEELMKKKLRVSVTLDSPTALKEQPLSANATWLDRIFGDGKDLKNAAGDYRRQVERELLKRKTYLLEHGIQVNRDTYYDLLKRDEQKLCGNLEKRFGRLQTLKVGEEINGKVVAYEPLGDGYRMVIKTNAGILMRKVGRRENQMPFNSEVTVSKTLKSINGRPIEIMKVTSLEKITRRERTRKRK